ncbi:MAG: proton-conducting membrane transporter, partial [bacterium]|nr:proton-conducting membrane transporter [bacterium]
GIKAGQVFGVATFYSQFRLEKAGKHRIKVCIGTACHVKGAGEIFTAYKEYLEIDQDNDTDKNGVFTVEKVACLGCCVLAPAVQIDDIICGNLTIGKVGDTITDFLKSLTGMDQKKEKSIGNDKTKGEVRICRCSSCSASGANKVYKEIEKVIGKNRLDVVLKSVSCSGMSYKAPIIEIVDNYSISFFYGNVTPQIIEEIIFSHFKPDILGKLHFYTKRLLFKIGQNWRGIPFVEDLVDMGKREDSIFGNCQKKLVTETAGELEPQNLAEYRKNGGFKALEIVLAEDRRENIIGILKKSGLRGRGGAGYQTYLKWEKIFHGGLGKRYLICNGDEGDPGAFMDRMILESFPFRVLEGIAIAALTLGIREVFLYIRAEYPLAIKRIRKAVKLCMDDSLLADIDIAFRICEGAGAFVCGEETALIEAIEGKRGEPREKGPYPAEFGLYGCPTLVNNVETFASIPWIIGHGGEKFSALGTKDSPGTKLFALAGKINRGGLIEVPMGITLREIVNDIGGGIENDGRLKAIQIGGPSGGCVPDYL